MTLSRETMTDEQRKSVALEYLKAFDNGGATSSGASILDLFADDAQVYFPKWGLANGKDEIGRMFGGKHHTTVLHSVQKIDKLRQRDADLNRLIHSVIDSIN